MVYIHMVSLTNLCAGFGKTLVFQCVNVSVNVSLCTVLFLSGGIQPDPVTDPGPVIQGTVIILYRYEVHYEQTV